MPYREPQKPGRKKGKDNLIYEDGVIINKHRVKFTDEERETLNSLVDRANAKRRRMLADEAALPILQGGVDTGHTVKEQQLMGRESDFILAPKTKSLNRYRSKEDYNRYIRNLNRVLDENYINKRVELYKTNHITALHSEFGDMANDIADYLNSLSTEEYMKVAQKDDILTISFTYGPQEKQRKLNQIRESIGMYNNEQDKSRRRLRNNNGQKRR